MKRTSLLTVLLMTVLLPLNGQVYIQLTLEEFLKKVRENNFEYAAERLNISIADAEIISASVFNNPQITFGYYTNELRNMQMGQGGNAEIGQTISPGRRSAAISVAVREKELSEAMLTDFMRNLREQAVVTWLETVKQRELFEIKRNSYRDQIKMMESDSIRRSVDYDRDVDAMQSRVETGIIFGEIIDHELLLHQLYQQLSNYCGTGGIDTIYIPERKNIWNAKEFNLSDIVNKAVETRYDITAAKREIDLSKYQTIAAKKERIPEFDVFLGFGLNSEVRNELAPAPRHSGIEFGVSFPIPLFNKNRGEIISAKTKEMQAELRYNQACVQVRTEVVNAYNEFLAADRKIKYYTGGLVKTAREVLEEKRAEYQNGEIHLIEVLDAQRSYDDILVSFFTSIYDKSIALVKLESAIGIWEINDGLPASAGTASPKSSATEPPKSSATESATEPS